MANQGWTVETAMNYTMSLRAADMQRNDQRFDAYNKAIDAALASARFVTEKADVANEKRFDSINELRNAMKDQQATYITRTEVYALVTAAGALAGGIAGLIDHFVH